MKKEDTTAPPETSPRGRILFAEDEELFRLGVRNCLVRVGFTCDCANSAAAAIELLRANDYDVLLSDINMPGNSGLELIEEVPAIVEGLPVILLTGEPSVSTAARSVRLRVMAYLTKPPDIEELCHLLDLAVAERRSLRLLNDTRQRLRDWDREIERIQTWLQKTPAPDRQAAMQKYLRLSVRHVVVSLIELENLLIHDGGQLGTDQAVEKRELLNALRKTVGTLKKTKDHFKSKELGELRKELETLLG